jgi:hypothetical protein
MIMAQQTIMLHKDYLTLFEKCQLAYSYDKLVTGVKNKASLCRQIGIDWDSYYCTKHILEKKYHQQEYKDKLEELKHKLSHEDKRQTPEKNRIRYAYNKVRKWDKEIKTIASIPSTVRYFRSRGYSNMFIELTIKRKITGSLAIFGPFSILGQCVYCGSKLCQCEPSQYIGRPRQLSWYAELEDKEITEWLNGNEHSEEQFADAVNTIRLQAMVGGWENMRMRRLE